MPSGPTASRSPRPKTSGRKPDTRRVNSLLGWSPENSLEDILGRVISYVREQRANAAVARY